MIRLSHSIFLSLLRVPGLVPALKTVPRHGYFFTPLHLRAFHSRKGQPKPTGIRSCSSTFMGAGAMSVSLGRYSARSHLVTLVSFANAGRIFTFTYSSAITSRSSNSTGGRQLDFAAPHLLQGKAAVLQEATRPPIKQTILKECIHFPDTVRRTFPCCHAVYGFNSLKHGCRLFGT